MSVKSWEKSTNKIYRGVVLYYIASFFADMANIDYLANLIRGYISSSFNIIELLYICKIAVSVGAVIFFLGLKEFKTTVNKADEAYINRIYNAGVILFVGSVVSFLPTPSTDWIVDIINIIAMVIMITAFGDLMNSKTFVRPARKGASKLRIAMIWTIVAIIIGWIPIIGSIGYLLSFIAFFFTLNGWKAITKGRRKEQIILVNFFS